MKSTQTQRDRLYELISERTTPETHGGDMLDMIRDIVGRWDFRYYDELAYDEMRKVIETLEGKRR